MPTVTVDNRTPSRSTISDPRGGPVAALPARTVTSFDVDEDTLEHITGQLVQLDNRERGGVKSFHIEVQE